MSVTHRLEVPPDRAGTRLDRFLADALTALSRSRIRQLIDGGHVTLSGAVAKPSARLRGGEAVEVAEPAPAPSPLVPEDRPLRVLYEDAHLLVVEKPAGMVVHPAPGHPAGTLVNVLLAKAGPLSGIGGVERPGIVHRLDRDTSGLLVVAKSDAAHARLSANLAAHRVVRRYRAIVWGRPPRAEGTVRTRVGRHPVHRKKMAVLAAGGREAVSRYRLVVSIGSFSLLEFCLETGRTHQVRLHGAHLGCPVVGDDVYGRPRAIPLGRGVPPVSVDRYLLHAFHLGFDHPVTGERLEFTVDDPPEFGRFLAAVRAAGVASGRKGGGP